MSAANESVLVVDDENRPVGTAPRWRMRAERLAHRATYIIVFASDGRVLVQQRTDTKDVYPGYFNLAAGGVVVAGESFEESAAREAFEELGIEGVALDPCFNLYYEDERSRCFGRVYACVHDGPFRLQAEEVVRVEFMEVDAALAGAAEPVTPDTRLALERWIASQDG